MREGKIRLNFLKTNAIMPSKPKKVIYAGEKTFRLTTKVSALKK
jgi:hypothetical protein